jgi:hypothetical protein
VAAAVKPVSGERARPATALQAADEGRAASLLIHGGAGVAKSALLEDTATRARGTAY